MPNDERILETMPTGTLGLVATDSCIGLAQKVDAYFTGLERAQRAPAC